VLKAARERTAAKGGGTMSNQERLNQLIEDAKRRQDERRRKELEQFQTEVQNLLGQEVCDLLDLKYRLDTAGGAPNASFRIGSDQWRLARNRDRAEDEQAGFWLQIGPNARVIPVSTADDVLLAIDEARSH
jgi:hypothetical protein